MIGHGRKDSYLTSDSSVISDDIKGKIKRDKGRASSDWLRAEDFTMHGEIIKYTCNILPNLRNMPQYKSGKSGMTWTPLTNVLWPMSNHGYKEREMVMPWEIYFDSIRNLINTAKNKGVLVELDERRAEIIKNRNFENIAKNPRNLELLQSIKNLQGVQVSVERMIGAPGNLELFARGQVNVQNAKTLRQKNDFFEKVNPPDY